METEIDAAFKKFLLELKKPFVITRYDALDFFLVELDLYDDVVLTPLARGGFLVACLKNPERWLNQTLKEAMEGFMEFSDLNWFLSNLDDRDPLIRFVVVEALPFLDILQGSELLLQYLKDPSNPVWLTAKIIYALGIIRDSTAVELLLQFLKSNERSEVTNAVEALGAIEDLRAVGPLIDLLRRIDMRIRGVTCIALGKLGDPRALEPMLFCLKYSYDYETAQIIEGLGELGDTRAVEPIIPYLKYEWEIVRAQAALTLGKLGDQRAIQPLKDCLEDPSKRVRNCVVDSLKLLNSKKPISFL